VGRARGQSREFGLVAAATARLGYTRQARSCHPQRGETDDGRSLTDRIGRLAGMRCRNPRRGRGSLRRTSRLSAMETPRGRFRGACLHAIRVQARGRRFRLVRGRRGERVPLEGMESPREARVRPLLREAGDNGLPRRAKPGRRARICTTRVGGSVRANARRAGWAERPDPCRGRGNLRRANPKSVAV
jgi:hypothetical protein